MIDSKIQLLQRLTGGLAVLAISSVALAGGPPPDTDSDGVDDFNDNCLLVQNPAQRDTDGDGFGNFCDADFDNNGVVNLADLAVMKNAFFTSGPDLEEDMDGDTFVNFADLLLMKAGFFLPPGPGAINVAPNDISLVNASVNENEPAGTAVGNFSTTDPNLADTHTYTLVAGAGDTDNAQFAIVGDQLQTAAVLNYEAPDNCVTSATTCSIRVQTDDGNGGTYQESFIINILDANDDPTDIALDNNSVDEEQPAGTPVGNLSTTDEDTADTHAYTLVAGSGDADNSKFQIIGNQLQTNAVFDFEGGSCATTVTRGAGSTCSIRVQSDDGNGGQYEESFTITINDTVEPNLPPTIITSATPSVVENTTPVIDINSTDPEGDVEGAGLTYSLSGGADQASFNLNVNTGQLDFTAAPDFENPGDANTDNVYEVQVTVTDSGGATDVQNLAVTVTDANEAPSITTSATPSVAENTTPVIDINSTDPDGDVEGAGLTYSKTGGADQALFTLNVNTGQLDFAAAPDFENPGDANTDNVYLVQVTVTDSGGLTDVQDLSVTVTDVNDNTAPTAVDDLYTSAIGNTLFQLVAATGGTPVPPTVQVVGNILDNDTDPDGGDTLSTTAQTVATAMGGSATIDGNGRFVYTPAPGFPGSGAGGDSFTYQVCDTGPLCDNGTVMIEGTNMVWYVDDSSPNNPGTGIASDPFRNLSSAGGPSLAGETLFVHSGTQTTGVTLKANQRLIGEGVALVVNTITLVDAGTRPVIANAGGTAISLGTSNTVRGLDITGSNTGITGNGFGTLTADTIVISTSGGAALDLNNGAGSAIFDSVSSSGSASQGIDLSAVSGMFTFGSGMISGSTGDAFQVFNSTATIGYNGSIAAGSALAVDISSQTQNSVSLGGAINSSAQGISLTNNGGGTINLSGGILLSTGVNPGIVATGGGTLNICSDTNCSAPGGVLVANTIQTGTASALSVLGVDIGSEGLTFQSISSNGGGNSGIVLNNTGTAGGLTVTGDGSTTLGGNDSGGIIQNKTGAANGIVLIDTRDVSLQNMTIGDTIASTANGPDAMNNIANDGIFAGSGVTNLTLQSVTIARTGGHGINADNGLTNLVVDDSLILNAGDGQEEHGLNLDELRGDNFVRDSQFDAFNETAIEVVNASGQVDLTISNTRFQDNKATVGNAGEEAILIEALGSAQIVVLVTGGSVFDDIATQAIQALSIGSTSMIHLTVENSSFVEHASGDGIIIMNPDGGGSGNITVRGNTFTDDDLGPFAIIAKNDSSGTLDATIQDNTVTDMQLLNVNHDDIGGAGAANGTSRVLVGGAGLGNNVGYSVPCPMPGFCNNIAIDVIATETGPVGTAPDLSLTVLNNTSSQPDGNFTFTPGLRIDAQNNSRLNANISGNAFQGDPTFAGGSGIELRELDSAVVGLQGFGGGAPGNCLAPGSDPVSTFLDTANPASMDVSFVCSEVDNNIGSGTATLPTATMLPSP